MEKQVICVDEQDRQTGIMGKTEAHEKGILHRAFSIFIFNDKGELLLQQRAQDKYHSGGLWTNTCCSHPQPGEDILESAHIRLQEEMGFDCNLKEIFQFTYRAELDHGLTEHELDHVFVGRFNGRPVINQEEASAYRWIGLKELKQDLQVREEAYTEWFKIAIVKVLEYKEKQVQNSSTQNQYMTIGMCVGMVFGGVLGEQLFGGYTMGMLIGLSIGLIIGVTLDGHKKEQVKSNYY